MEETLGKRICQKRKELGLTQEQLAEQLGVTAQAVSKWENNISFPDIAMLPKLADLFGITTDHLLGRTKVSSALENTAHPSEQESHNFYGWKRKKQDSILLALFVLTVGCLYLLSEILNISISFWNILWPSAILFFGLGGLYPRFSLFRLGCALLGGYFLADRFIGFSLTMSSGTLVALLIVFFGLALLTDTLQNKNGRSFVFHKGNHFSEKIANDLSMGEDSFDFSASFGEITQPIALNKLETGNITTNFGEFKVDLSCIEHFTDTCTVSVNISFGELTILVPKRCRVKANVSTMFANLDIHGHPEDMAAESIQLNGKVSFGQLKMIYV